MVSGHTNQTGVTEGVAAVANVIASSSGSLVTLSTMRSGTDDVTVDGGIPGVVSVRTRLASESSSAEEFSVVSGTPAGVDGLRTKFMRGADGVRLLSNPLGTGVEAIDIRPLPVMVRTRDMLATDGDCRVQLAAATVRFGMITDVPVTCLLYDVASGAEGFAAVSAVVHGGTGLHDSELFGVDVDAIIWLPASLGAPRFPAMAFSVVLSSTTSRTPSGRLDVLAPCVCLSCNPPPSGRPPGRPPHTPAPWTWLSVGPLCFSGCWGGWANGHTKTIEWSVEQYAIRRNASGTPSTGRRSHAGGMCRRRPAHAPSRWRRFGSAFPSPPPFLA